MNELRGTGVALVTPFQTDGSVDIAGLKAVTRHVIDGGVDFLVILGTTGESVVLDQDEQRLVIDTVLEANADEVPYVIGAGGNNTAAVARQMNALDRAYKAAAYLSVVPYYNKPTQAGLYQHFKHLAESTPTNIVLYNVPGRTAINMTAETSLRLAHECGNIVAIKEASGNLEQCMDLVKGAPKDFLVLSGDDSLILPQLALGMSGVISVAANAIPREFTAVVNAGLDGDFLTARANHYKILDLMRLLFVEGNPAGVKAALAHLGIGGQGVRLPLVAASPELATKIVAAMPN